jgi:hypothetical protein
MMLKCQCKWDEGASYGRQVIDAALKCKNLTKVKVKYMTYFGITVWRYVTA